MVVGVTGSRLVFPSGGRYRREANVLIVQVANVVRARQLGPAVLRVSRVVEDLRSTEVEVRVRRLHTTDKQLTDTGWCSLKLSVLRRKKLCTMYMFWALIKDGGRLIDKSLAHSPGGGTVDMGTGASFWGSRPAL